MSTTSRPRFSFVLEHAPAEPATAREHFSAKLAFETDPADVNLDLMRGANIVVLDTRAPEHYEACRIPGAISLPHRNINAETTATLPKDALLVTYCWGVGCNAATRAAAKLADLGFHVKEMIGGIEYWRREGHPIDGILGDDAPLVG